MTHKERMFAVLRGEPTDMIPWAPRLDLWYNAHKRAGTLPARYRGATLRDITDDLDFGYHAQATCIVPWASITCGRCRMARACTTWT